MPLLDTIDKSCGLSCECSQAAASSFPQRSAAMPIEQGDRPKSTPFGHGKQMPDNPSVVGQDSDQNQGYGGIRKSDSPDPVSPGKQPPNTGRVMPSNVETVDDDTSVE
jgi:hypothetical protein